MPTREYPKNRLKRKLENGEIGVIANGLNNSGICDFLGQFGFDAAFIDFEHGDVSWAELADISRACELWDMATITRVNKLDEALILRTLDQGAAGVVVPHIITVDDAKLAAEACRYPPDGIRGVAGNRKSYGVSNYHLKANAEIMCTALIEDIEAIDNLPEIIKVEGVDVFYIAPSDMAASMGHTGNPELPEVQQEIKRAIEIVVDAGKVAGTLVNDQNVEKFLGMGVTCIGTAWQQWVASGAEKFMGDLKNR